MAQSYDRRINMYINVDGKQVTNNVKSIRAEMTKIVNMQKLMTIGSKEYEAATQKIKYLNGILTQHAAQVRDVQKGWSMKGMAEGFNRYFAMVTAAAASLTGLVVGFKQVIKTFNDYEERVDNLSALTGLAGDNLEWLSQKAKDLSTSTLEGGIRVTQSAQEIIDAFTKTGSARPELLKNKEALVATTEEAIILSNAAKTELQPAIEALTMVMNQYNVPATEARRIINALAAGSKEGAGEIPYLTTAFEKAGTVAADAGISIETLVATVETLAPRISQPEIAGRSLKGVILDLQNGADDTNPAIVGLATALENLGKKNLTVTELTKKFGTENITTAKILIDNVEELKKYEAAVTGTNVALEQAAINTDNNNAKLAQAKNRLNVMSIELGEKLAPALQISTNGLSYFIKGLTISIDFFIKYKALIVTLVATVVSYTIATKLATLWEARANKEKLISIALGKLQALAYNAQFAAIALYNAGLALLKGNLVVATIQFRAFTAAMMANPIGLIVGGIVAIGTAVYFLTTKVTAAQKAQKVMNDINLEARKNIVEEKIQLQSLLSLARNEKLSKADRLNAIRQLNALSPVMLGFLNLENINTKKATDATNEYTESLLQNARAQAAKEKLVEIEKQLLDLQSGNGADPTFWQGIGNGLLSFGNAAVFANRNAATATANLTEKQAALNLQKEKLLGITQKQAEQDLKASGGKDEGNASSGVKDQKSAFDKGIAALESAHNARMAVLTSQYETEKWSKEKFEQEQLDMELVYLVQRKALLQVFGQETIDIDRQINENRLKTIENSNSQKIEKEKDLNKQMDDSDKEFLKRMEETAKTEEEILSNSINDTANAIDDSNKKLAVSTDEELYLLEQRAQTYQMISETVVGTLSDIFNGSLDEYASYGDALVLMSLQILKQMVPIWSAQILGFSLADPVSVATVGIKGMANFAIVTGLMYAGIAAAEGAVKKGMANKRDKSTGRAIGGFMQGEQSYTVAEAGPEWIAPNWMLKHPITGSILANMEAWRNNPVMLTQGAIQANSRSNNTSGSYAPQSPVIPNSFRDPSASGSSIDSATAKRFTDAVERLLTWDPAISMEMLERKQNHYNKITKGGLK